jgi:hypothetical protein
MAKRPLNTTRDDSFEDKRVRRESSRNRRNLCRDERARRRSKQNRERLEGRRNDLDRYSSSRHSKRKYKDVVCIFNRLWFCSSPKNLRISLKIKCYYNKDPLFNDFSQLLHLKKISVCLLIDD